MLLRTGTVLLADNFVPGAEFTNRFLERGKSLLIWYK